MNILGISCWYHDAAACLIQDGKIAAAAQEERFTRVKHDSSFPRHAAAWCLQHGGISADALDAVAFYDKPFLKFERILETTLASVPQGLALFLKAMPVWLKRSLWIPDLVRRELQFEGPVLFPEHHESHAASAFFPSPFERAAIITADGVGEWATTSVGSGLANTLELTQEVLFPHSLGLFYSSITGFCGFRVNSGEYKLMGLAPYGQPRYVQRMREELIDLRDDGSFRLNLEYFAYTRALRMTTRRFERLFGGPAREPEAALSQRELDLARSAQAIVEEAMLKMARHARACTQERNLCMAGGVALNCVANGRIQRERIFDSVWIQPAAGDAGGALGAALMAWHGHAGMERTPQSPDAMGGALLGPAYSDDRIRGVLEQAQLPYSQPGYGALPEAAAALLAEQKVVGWFQGRMEFGPRALGSRSILADPRRLAMQSHVNQRIKFRESFRPFAPVVREESVGTWFELDSPSPYMLLTAQVKGARISGSGLDRQRGIESGLAAVTHVDGSARVQTVSQLQNPLLHRLLGLFESRTDCDVLVNTSFNVRGEPLVCTPEDAVACFLRTHMDALVIGPYIAHRPATDAKPMTQAEIAATFGLD